jgi:hypothetical protein
MTLIPAKHTFTIWQASTFFEVLTLYETSDTSLPKNFYPNGNQTPDYSAEMVIRDKPRSSTIHWTLHSDSANNGNTDYAGIVFPSGTSNQGKIQLIINDADTADFDWKAGVYDLTITNLESETSITDTLLYGGIKVLGV